MNIKEIQNRIKKLKDLEDDIRVLHENEDILREDFLKYIAKVGTPSIQEKTKLILSTSKLARGERWYD